MVIQTFEHSYTVVSLREANRLGTVFICRDAATGEQFSVLCIRDQKLASEVLLYLTNHINTTVFTDFVEYFKDEDQLCVVMKYRDETTLDNHLLRERPSLKERLEIGRRIVEQMVLLEMPEYFQCNCLRADRIVIYPNMDVFFNYSLTNIDTISHATGTGIVQQFADVFHLLFRQEIDKETIQPLVLFYNHLRAAEYIGNIDLYTQYKKLMDTVLALPGAEEGKPQSFWYRVWEKVKRAAKKLRKLLMILLVLLAIAYLIYTVGTVNRPIKETGNFDRIGTVELV